MNPTVKKIIVAILIWEAKLVLKKYKPRIIAITGSVGKTTTKDAVAAVAERFVNVRKSEKSFNSEIGLPLTILGAKNPWNDYFLWLETFWNGLLLVLFPHPFPEWLVLEVGVGKPGDMKKTASWLSSDVVIITHFGTTPVHVEFFPSKKDIIREKSFLITTLKRDGTLILNADDPDVLALKSAYDVRSYSYGFSPEATLRGALPQALYDTTGMPSGMTFRVESDGNSLPVTVKDGVGAGHLASPLAALAVAYSQKWNMVEAVKAVSEFSLPPARMRLIPGLRGSMIIDDSYNASPAAMQAALAMLESLKVLPGGKRIAVLGDMLELGKHTEEEHRAIGTGYLEGVSLLVTVGQRALWIKEAALAKGFLPGHILSFATSEEAKAKLVELIAPHDIVLVKGSQGIRTERIVEALMAHPEDAGALLCRQDPEWKKRK